MKKTCTHCKKEKPLESYNRRAKSKDGRRSVCRDCDMKTREAWEKRVESEGGPTAPAPSADSPLAAGGEHPKAATDNKVIGRIEPPAAEPGAPTPKVREWAVDPTSEAEIAAAAEYAAILNRKLPIRKRAALITKIALNADGPAAALALQALRDINLATKLTNPKGVQVEAGPLFVLPGDAQIKMG